MPKPKTIDIAAVANTNIRTSGGFVELPRIRLKITAIIVIDPIRISVRANIIIPDLGFINCIPLMEPA